MAQRNEPGFVDCARRTNAVCRLAVLADADQPVRQRTDAELMFPGCSPSLQRRRPGAHPIAHCVSQNFKSLLSLSNQDRGIERLVLAAGIPAKACKSGAVFPRILWCDASTDALRPPTVEILMSAHCERLPAGVFGERINDLEPGGDTLIVSG